MYRIEKHIIKNNKQLDELTFCSKNLYNRANYIIRKEFIETSKLKEKKLIENAIFLGYVSIYNQLKNVEEYKILYAQTTQQILRILEKNWKCFFKSIKIWNKNKFSGKPGLPKYLNKKGRYLLIYPSQHLTIKNGILKIPKTQIEIKTKIVRDKLKEVRIVPIGNKNFQIEIVYEKEKNNLNLNNNIVIGIDFGMNNLMVITSNQSNIPSWLINGKSLKSINQYYNKKLSKLNSMRINDCCSYKIKKLIQKRNNKVNDYLHKASRKLLNYCIKYNIGEIIIGHNNYWKQNINIGKINNQKFHQIPFSKLIKMIQYKAEDISIEVKLTEESYTSKCDHLVLETMKYHDKYSGKRIKRGLFRSSIGKIINSDINGCIGILRKENAISEDFILNLRNRGLVFNPVKICIFNKILKIIK